jgi:hypothetical protein
VSILLCVVAAMAGGCGVSGLNPGSPNDAGNPADASDPGDASNPGDTSTPSRGGPPPFSCNVVWRDFQHGTELDDQLWGMTIDDHNNVYIAGYEHGFGYRTNIEPDGDSRGVIAKLDPTGTMQWSTPIDSHGTESIEDVAIEPGTGRIFAIGRTSGAFPGFTNQGQFDELLLALDSNGHVLQVVEQGDALPQHPARLAMGVDHDLVVAGYNDTFVEGNAVLAFEDGFVQRVSVQDGTGQGGAGIEFNQHFLQTVPNSQTNRVTSAAVETDGSHATYVTGFILGGRSAGPYVKKLDADGTPLWSTPITRNPFDSVTGVALSPAGLLLITGSTFGTLGKQNFGQQDAFVMNIDKATGQPLWATQAGSTDSDAPVGLGFDADNNIYIAGITLGSVVDGEPSRGDIDAFAMKFDPNGNLLGSWQTGTEGYDFVTAMVVDHCGNLLIGGFTRGALASDGPAPAGNDDMFVVRASFP